MGAVGMSVDLRNIRLCRRIRSGVAILSLARCGLEAEGGTRYVGNIAPRTLGSGEGEVATGLAVIELVDVAAAELTRETDLMVSDNQRSGVGSLASDVVTTRGRGGMLEVVQATELDS